MRLIQFEQRIRVLRDDAGQKFEGVHDGACRVTCPQFRREVGIQRAQRYDVRYDAFQSVTDFEA